VANALREPPTIVVYGGSGFFGRLVVNDLLGHTEARLVIASRRSPWHPMVNSRVAYVCSDLNDIASVRATLVGASVVVHCAGPYQFQDPTLVRAAIESGVHYVDLAEDPEFVRQTLGFHKAAQRADVAIVSGASVVPGLTALLAQALHFDRADSIRTFVAPGTCGSRGLATVRSLLSGVGRPLRLLRGGRETMARGWSKPEWVEFPPPIGWRLQYLAIETADRDVLSRELGAQSIEFKAGSEFPWVNRSLGAVARLRARTNFPSLERWANPIRKYLQLLGRFGTDAGGVIVEVAGILNCELTLQQVAVTAAGEGERIPSLLAAIGAAALLRGELTARGALRLSTWLPTTQLFEELHRRGLQVWLKPGVDADWRRRNEMAEMQQ
jgi:hypothetical protein